MAGHGAVRPVKETLNCAHGLPGYCLIISWAVLCQARQSVFRPGTAHMDHVGWARGSQFQLKNTSFFFPNQSQQVYDNCPYLFWLDKFYLSS